MPELKEYIKNIDRMIINIREGLPDMLQAAIGGNLPSMTSGSNLITAIRKRVQETGKDSKGADFKPYSKKPILIGYDNTPGTTVSKIVYKKLASSRAKRRELKYVTIKGHRLFELSGGYDAAKRIFAPNQNGKVDFTVSGTMWRGIGVLNTSTSEDIITVEIGAKTDDSEIRLEGNEKKRHGILEPSKSEIDIVEKAAAKWIENKFNEFLNAD